jgi:DNA ligase-1
LGFSDKTLLDALSVMERGDKSLKGVVEEAYNNRTDIGQIAKVVKERGEKGLGRLSLVLGVPVMPALCQRLPTTEEMIEKMGKVAVEPKYDGTRLQIHFSKQKKWKKEGAQLSLGFESPGSVRIFTRNLENTTHMFPDLAEALFKEVAGEEAILDGEAIGFDPKSGKLLPFQETMTRKRKYGIGEKTKEVPLKLFCFDLLYKDGKSLLKEPLEKRREALEKMLSSKNKVFLLAPQQVTTSAGELKRYHRKQIEIGLEGIVVKKWEAPYDPGKRGYTWVKLKQEKGKKGGGLADTLDCVVLGYYRGRGKRAQFGIGAFLVGVLKGEDFVTISKIGTGLSDEQWRGMATRCEKVKTGRKPEEYQAPKDLAPDVWCRPEIVVEIEADNITKSPLHSAGYALRFPRLVRFRDDKSRESAPATTLEEVEVLFRQQKGR